MTAIPTTRRGLAAFIAGLPLLGELIAPGAKAQAPSTQPAPCVEMLTIFLRHDETKTVDEINQHLKQTGWFKNFPPPGVEDRLLECPDGDRPGGDGALRRRAAARNQPTGGG